MERLSVGQMHEIATVRAAQLVRDLSESNQTTSFKPIIEPEGVVALFTQIVARHLKDTYEIVLE